MSARLLLAASGLAREAIGALRASGPGEIRLLDDDEALHGTCCGGVPVVGGIDDISRFSEESLTVAAGRGVTRAAIVERLANHGVDGTRYDSIVHPSVSIGPGCTIGAGSILLAGAVLTADVTVGAHVVVMPNVVLTHDVVLADYATVCANAVIGGSVRVGRAAYIGQGAAIKQDLTIGEQAIVGMGAVLVSDQPSRETWVGVPARKRN